MPGTSRLPYWMLMAGIILPCGAAVAEDLLFDAPPTLHEDSALEIARRYSRPGPSGWTTGTSPDASLRRAIHEARVALFASDGLLEDGLQPRDRETTAVLSRLKQQLLVDLARTPRGTLSRGRNAEAHHLLAMLAFRLRDQQESLHHAARAVMEAPLSSRYHSNLAFFLQTTGHRRQAKVVYEHARRLDPDNTATHLGLLFLAAEEPLPGVQEIEALVRDWHRREKVPELRRMAAELAAIFSRLRTLRLPARNAEHDAAADEVRLIKDMLRGLFGAPGKAAPGRDLDTPLAVPADARVPPASRRARRPVRDPLSSRVGGSRR